MAGSRKEITIKSVLAESGGVLCPLIFVVSLFVFIRYTPIDDAFISYRYAQHLARGSGLVWNIGQEPTEGYTNFLFVILLAAGIRLGIDPLTGSLVLNGFGIIAVAVSIYLLTKMPEFFIQSIPWRIAVTTATTCSSLLLVNAFSGLETGFWAGLLLAGGFCARQFHSSHSVRDISAFTIVLFFASLTRPETIVLFAAWVAILFFFTHEYKKLTLAVGAYALAGTVYLAWKYSYFGYLLPNPFYVKAASSLGASGGISYVASYVRDNWPLLIILPTLGFLSRKRLSKSTMLLSPPLLLLVIYLFFDPLMGGNYRFLVPAHLVMMALAYILIAIMMDRNRMPLIRKLNLAIVFLLLLVPDIMFPIRALAYPSWNGLFLSEEQVGKTIRTIPEHEKIVIALGDTGVLPYYSEARVLDLVGLNDNQIARRARANGPTWVIEYALSANPDLVGFYSNVDGTIFDEGHGVIGSSYSKLFCDPVFQRQYRYVGGFDFSWANLQWFVNTRSPYFAALNEKLHRIVDFTEYKFTIPHECVVD
jgi:arabinofuranosyltransferase